MKHDNYEVAIKIVFDKDSREILGAQMVSRDSAISMAIHMFSLAIQEHVTIDKLALTDLFFLPHFNKPYNYITMAALTANNAFYRNAHLGVFLLLSYSRAVKNSIIKARNL